MSETEALAPQGPASAAPADEPLSAILAEMRAAAKSTDLFNGEEVGEPLIRGSKVEEYADRIESAAERERENTIYAGRNGEMTLDECITRCDNNSGDNPRGRDVAQIGGWLRELRERRSAPDNAAAMREALEYVLQFDATDEAAEEDGLTDAERIAEYADHIEECQKKARAALAAPPRNCDVGTAEEQRRRFDEFCEGRLCSECPFTEAGGDYPIEWANTPAQEGGAE